MKFEEVMLALREGKKVRRASWTNKGYVLEKSYPHSLYFDAIFADDWEIIEEPEPDWESIIKNKCLCWFWDGDDRNKDVISYLVAVSSESYEPYKNTSGCRWSHCRPVRKEEVKFYGDRNETDNDL